MRTPVVLQSYARLNCICASQLPIVTRVRVRWFDAQLLVALEGGACHQTLRRRDPTLPNMPSPKKGNCQSPSASKIPSTDEKMLVTILAKAALS
jgi:hypothetical protein